MYGEDHLDCPGILEFTADTERAVLTDVTGPGEPRVYLLMDALEKGKQCKTVSFDGGASHNRYCETSRVLEADNKTTTLQQEICISDTPFNCRRPDMRWTVKETGPRLLLKFECLDCRRHLKVGICRYSH